MKKKTVHIISHSHWDREWYIPYEHHHMLLVQLIDNVLDLFETDPEFKYFHLDGQTILLDDYLEVRPENRGLIQKYIDNGQLRIGSFYILQDAFLISGESNVRNALIGTKEAARWGVEGEKIGYFPDTFGLLGQTPQLMREMGIDNALYGRGIKPTGFNNTVDNNDRFKSMYSEMFWQGPDESEILGVLFANWYSNGNEIPSEAESAKIFWEKKLADVEQFASSTQLLMMNGCDHQPVQKDLTKAIRLANELFPEYEFIHSNFEIYLAALKDNLPNDLTMIHGELRSQNTNGWYTLANTASSRIYLKQFSQTCSNALEQIIEPLATLAYQYGYPYPSYEIEYAWKILLQNYPHDSICGCGVDSIYRTMLERFHKVKEIIEKIYQDITKFLSSCFLQKPLKTEYVKHFQVFNTTNTLKSGKVTSTLELDRKYFSEDYPNNCYQAMLDFEIPNFLVTDSNGQIIPAIIKDAGVRFGFDLPDNAFRQPYMARYITVTISVDNIKPFSGCDFYLIESDEKSEQVLNYNDKVVVTDRTIANEYLSVKLEDNNTLSIRDLTTGIIYRNQLQIEDVGDIGNEYIFREAGDKKRVYGNHYLVDTVVMDTSDQKALQLKYEIEVPESADDNLKEEQNRVIDITNRTAGRSSQMVKIPLTMTLSLANHSRGLNIRIEGVNTAKDHRMRILFELLMQSEYHLADVAYEWVKRDNFVSEEWENPTNPQPMHYGVSIHNKDTEREYGLTIGTHGLYEYEVTPIHVGKEDKTTLAITILRSCGEMGDWGYFPTEDSQCLGDFHADLYWQPWDSQKSQKDTLKKTMSHFVPLVVTDEKRCGKSLVESNHKPELFKSMFIDLFPEDLIVNAIKKHEYTDGIIVRITNYGDTEYNLQDYISTDYLVTELDVLERIKDTVENNIIQPYQIKTILLSRK